MAQLVSGIGIEQRKHTSLRTKAAHYRRMAEAILACGMTTRSPLSQVCPAWEIARLVSRSG